MMNIDSYYPDQLEMLNRLAYWFLFPIANDFDATTMFSPVNNNTTTATARTTNTNTSTTTTPTSMEMTTVPSLSLVEVKHGMVAIFQPILSSILKRFFYREVDQSDWTHSLGTTFESCSSIASLSSSTSLHDGSDHQNQHQHQHCNDGSSGSSNDPLHVSISSLAKAYHAADFGHGGATIEEEEDDSGSGSGDSGGREPSQAQEHVQTQTFERQRHLDIESILKLPTMTYYDTNITATTNEQGENTEDEKHHEIEEIEENEEEEEKVESIGNHNLEWSWISVPKGVSSSESMISLEDMNAELGTHTNANANKDTILYKDDNCVICMETFQNGDRLRILPCNHRFHTTCIDKWLSGSFSHEDCITDICPTCKSTPLVSKTRQVQVQSGMSGSCGSILSLLDDDSMQSMNLDGEVPSWAFVRLGSRI